MITHIIYNDKFTVNFIKMINLYFSDEEQMFFVYGNPNFAFEAAEEKNVKYRRHVSHFFLKDMSVLASADLLVVHGVFSPELLVNLLLRPSLIAKTDLFFWGGDIYSHEKVSLRDPIIPMIKRCVVKRAYGIITLVDGDDALIREKYCARGIAYRGIYIFNPELQSAIHDVLKKSQSHDGINIQIGNSATRTNCHMEAFQILSKFRNQNIKIFVPLSYGDFEYRKEVILAGERIFGDKFVPITVFIPQTKYFEFLSTIDVAVFCNNRQQATENIETLMYLGAKIYLKAETTMARYYTDELKICVFDVKDIDNMSFDEFLGYLPENRDRNRATLDVLWNGKNFVDVWSRVFNKARKDKASPNDYDNNRSIK